MATIKGDLILRLLARASVKGSETEDNPFSEDQRDFCYSELEAEIDAYIWTYTAQYSVRETSYGSLLVAFH